MAERLELYDARAQSDFAHAMADMETLEIEKGIMALTESLVADYLKFQQSPLQGGAVPWQRQIARAPRRPVVSEGLARYPEIVTGYINVKLYPFFNEDEARFMIEYMIRAQTGISHIPVFDE